MCHAPAAEAKILGRRLSTRQGVRPGRQLGITATVQRCRTCGLVFTNPQPLPGSVGQHYGSQPEAYWAADYLEHGGAPAAHYIDEFHARWRGDRRAVTLDVGAGVGHTMVAFQQAGMDAWGIEPGVAFRQRALERPELRADRLIHAAVETADLHAAHFDFISMTAVLEHLADPAVALERAVGWLEPGGLMVATVPSSDWLVGRALNLVYRAQGFDYVTNVSPMHRPFHLVEFTRRSFAAHGLRAGYEIADSRVVVCDTYAPRGLRRIAHRVMERTGTGMILEVWLRKPEHSVPSS